MPEASTPSFDCFTDCIEPTSAGRCIGYDADVLRSIVEDGEPVEPCVDECAFNPDIIGLLRNVSDVNFDDLGGVDG